MDDVPGNRSVSADPDRIAPQPSLFRGLSGKLLVLTILFVMIAEVLIFVPSVANFRNVWLQNHLDTAEAASIVFLDSSDPMLSGDAQRYLLDATQSQAVAIREGVTSRLMASSNMPVELTDHIDLANTGPVEAIVSALSFLTSDGKQYYRVFAPMKSRNAVIELVQGDQHIVEAIRTYSRNVLFLSLAISAITAALVFLALYWIIVRPIRDISGNMTAFSEAPENSRLIYKPTKRRDEIGVAEHRLASFQGDLQITLRQKQRLADLGLAVSKINHDLRNILASALMLSDRLTALPDPTVQRFAPKLIKTIDRAVEYTRSVIAYGKALEAPPVRRKLDLHLLAEDVGELLGLDQNDHVVWQNNVPEHFEVEADSEQLFRVIMNVCRNSVQAMEGDEYARNNRLTIDAKMDERWSEITITDTGPGIADHVRDKLFMAFQGSTRAGGTGLGMSIAAELMRAHGGTIEVSNTGANGTTITLRLPPCETAAIGSISSK